MYSWMLRNSAPEPSVIMIRLRFYEVQKMYCHSHMDKNCLGLQVDPRKHFYQMSNIGIFLYFLYWVKRRDRRQTGASVQIHAILQIHLCPSTNQSSDFSVNTIRHYLLQILQICIHRQQIIDTSGRGRGHPTGAEEFALKINVFHHLVSGLGAGQTDKIYLNQ